jgi:hypothetical protein
MRKPRQAYGITKLQILSDPNQPGVRGLAITTERGTNVYAVDLEIATELGETVTKIMNDIMKERQ